LADFPFLDQLRTSPLCQKDVFGWCSVRPKKEARRARWQTASFLMWRSRYAWLPADLTGWQRVGCRWREQLGARVRRSSAAADAVGHTFLGEAGLGRPAQLLLASLSVASFLRIRLTPLHEAVQRSACELLLRSLRFARWRRRLRW